MKHARLISKLYHLLGYLAIWPALYALGVFMLTWHLIGDENPNAYSILSILLCAHSCYLLDRVKIADHRQDPADALALPTRATLFAHWAKPIRVLITVELLLATIAGWLIHPMLAFIPPIALGVVHLYAGRQPSPSSPRLKDLPATKSFFIAAGHLALSVTVLWGIEHDLFANLRPTHIAATLGVWMIVAGDAALCDIDDHYADSIYRTQSLSVILGQRKTWLIALGLIALGSSFIATNPQMLGLGLTLIITTLITTKNTNHRDFVDARLLPIVMFWLWASPTQSISV